jgi:hypothetical protein
MEPCATYQPWHDKKRGKTFLRPDDGKCLHYYFYFIDQDLGLCYVRVPTWCPFRLQVYLNGHHWLAVQLRQRHVDFTLLDNAFTQVADWNHTLPAEILPARPLSNLNSAKRLTGVSSQIPLGSAGGQS